MRALQREARAAPLGLLKVFAGAPDWGAAFSAGASGYLRSFAAPLVALPLYVLAVAVVARSGAPAEAVDANLWAAALSHAIDAFGFPLLLAAIAGPLRVREGYLAFVVVNNWAVLYLDILLLASSLLTRLGPDGLVVFSWASLLLIGLSIVLTWRIARETLSREIAPVVLVVVLDIAWGVMAGEVARRLLG